MKILGDLGVVGLIGFAVIVMAWSRALWRRDDPAGSAFALAGGITTLFCAHIGLPLFLFIAGARLALTRERGAESRQDARALLSPNDLAMPPLAAASPARASVTR